MHAQKIKGDNHMEHAKENKNARTRSIGIPKINMKIEIARLLR